MISFKEFLIEHSTTNHKSGFMKRTNHKSGFMKRVANMNRALSTIYGLGKPKSKPRQHTSSILKPRVSEITKKKIKANRESIEKIEMKIKPYEDNIKALRLANKKLKGV